MNDNAKTLLDQYAPKELSTIKTDRQLGIARFSPCGGYLVAGGFDGTIRRWATSTSPWSELTPLRSHSGWVQAVAFARSGQLVTADSWGRLAAWRSIDADTISWSHDAAHDGWIRAVATSADGTRVATCGRDRAVRVWSTADGSLQSELPHGEDVFCLAFHPDVRSLVAGDFKGVVTHWDLASQTIERQFDARALFKLDRLQDVGGARCLAFDRDGTLLAVAGTKPKVGANVQGTPTILLFDWLTGMQRQTLSLGADGDGFVYDLHFHRDRFLMAVTSGNPGTGKLVFIRPGDTQPFFATTKMPNCHSLAIHPTQTQFAVVATNGGSNGNGRQLDKNGEYPGNWSPVHVWQLQG